MLKHREFSVSDQINYDSHRFTAIDDCVRCMNCEIGIWNGYREFCGNPTL